MTPTESSSSASAVEEQLAVIVGELSERARQGQSIDIKPYLESHPECAERLCQLLPTIEALAGFATPKNPSEDVAGADQAVGSVLGDYRVLDVVGRGGMGIVYEAEQISIGRRVALKVLPFASVLDERQINRFKNEVRAAGTLDHPNIVPVHAVGQWRGVHYYAMTFIQGQSLAEVIDGLRSRGKKPDSNDDDRETRTVASMAESSGQLDEAPTDLYLPGASGRRSETHEPERKETAGIADALLSTASSQRNSLPYFRGLARLGVEAAGALHHAHENGVIHRDIKPANLMVDVKGKLWITDFGLARLEADAGMTVTGDLMGTLRYMSPEQAMAKRVAVDHRSDIYSLGVTLYELITLRPAYGGENRQELLRQIAFDEPERPRRINPAIPAELETIVQKAMAKSPQERYDTAQECADDLLRFIEDKPIRAKQPTAVQRFVKWSRRHRPLVATTSFAGILVLLVATVASAMLAQRERAGRLAATKAAERETSLRKQVSANADRIARLLAESYLQKSKALCEDGDAGEGMLWLAEALSITPDDARDLSRVLRANVAAWYSHLNSLTAVLAHRGSVTDVAFSPDGARVLTASRDGTARLWDAATGSRVGATLQHDAPVIAAQFNPQGDQILTATETGATRLWNATGDPLAQPVQHQSSILAIGWTRRGWQVVIRPEDRQVRIRSAASGTAIGTAMHHDAKILSAALDQDGERVITGASDKTARLWNVITGEALQKFAGNSAVTAVSFSRDGALVLTGTASSDLVIWSTKTGKVITSDWLTSVPTNIAVSKDGGFVVAGGRFTTGPQVLKPSQQRNHFIGSTLRHADDVLSVAFSPDASHVVSGSKDGTARIWRLAQSRMMMELPLDNPNSPRLRQDVSFSPNGVHILRVDGNAAHVWDAATGKRVGKPLIQEKYVVHAEYSPDGTRIVTGAIADNGRGIVQLWDASTFHPIGPQLVHADRIKAVRFSPDGEYIYTACRDETIRKWDAATGKPVGPPLKHDGGVTDLSISTDGLRIVSGSYGGLWLWNAKTGKLVREASQFASNVMSVAFDPRGANYFAGIGTDTIHRWHTSGRPIGKPIDVYNGGGIELVFSPDGKFLHATGQLLGRCDGLPDRTTSFSYGSEERNRPWCGLQP